MTPNSAAMTITWLVICIVLAPASLTAAEVFYRWVDANGVVHFSQTAPSGVPFEPVSPGSAGSRPAPSFYNPRQEATATARTPAVTAVTPTPATESDAGQQLSPEQQRRRAELQAETQTRLSELAEARRRNCERAREQLQALTAKARVRLVDAKGGGRRLTEEERAERIAKAEEAILLDCNDAG